MASDTRPAKAIEDRWITLDEAARRAGVTAGALRHRVVREWLSQGLVKQDQRPGRRAQWLVREDADPRFAIAKFAEQQSAEFDLRPFTAEQRDIILARERAVREWEQLLGRIPEGQRDQATEQYLVSLEAIGGIKTARPTLYRWRAAYRAQGRAGLVDGRWQSSGQWPVASGANGKTADPFLDLLQRLYLDPRRRSKQLCWELACESARQHGWDQRSYPQAKRFLARIPAQVLVRFREGKKAFEDKCEPIIRRDYSVLASNDIWCGDHHEFDVMVSVVDPTTGELRHVRPWITGWEDMRSRKLVGWRMLADPQNPNAQSILDAFVTGAAEHGVPRKVYIDNGKDYDSKLIQGQTKKQRRSGGGTGGPPVNGLLSDSDIQRIDGALVVLGVEVQHTWTYHGQSKPIERQFGTVCRRFAKLWDSYTSNTTATKPEDLARNLQAGKAPTLQEFTQAFADWIETDYHARVHEGDSMDGLSPAAAWEKNLASKRTLPLDTLKFACLPTHCPERKDKSGAVLSRGLIVGREGVTYSGIQFGGFDPEIQRLFGQRVQLKIDPTDLSHVFVLDMDGRLVGTARANLRLPADADAQTLKDAIKQKKAIRKTVRQYMDARPRMAADVPQLMLSAAARRSTGVPPVSGPERPDPPSISPVRTPFDAQLPAIRKAFEAPSKIAVGAESLGPARFDYASSYQSRDREGATDDDLPAPFSYRADEAREQDQP